MVPVVHPSKDALILVDSLANRCYSYTHTKQLRSKQMRRDHVGMGVFVIGMFITMCAVGGIEHTPGYLLEQVASAIVGMALMLVGVLNIQASE
jgi:hypothetical protein